MSDELELDAFDSVSAGDPETQLPVDEETAFMDAVDAKTAQQAQPDGKLAAQAAGDSMMIRGNPYETSLFHRAVMSGNAEQARNEAAQQHYNEQMQLVHQYVDDSILSPEVAPEMVVSTAVAETQRVQNRKQAPSYVEMAYMDKAAPDADQALRDEIAANKHMYSQLQTMWGERDTMDKAGDFLGSIWSFHTAKDFSDFADNVNEDEALNTLIGGKDIEEIALNFQSLNPSAKVAMFPRLIELAKEASGTWLGENNFLQVRQLLETFLGSSPDQGLEGFRVADVGLSSFDIPFTAAAKGAVFGAKALTGAEKLGFKQVMENAAITAAQRNNAPTLMADAGAHDRAAEASIIAARDPDLAASMNIDPLNAANAGLPFSNMLNPAITKGLSADMVNQLQQDISFYTAATKSITEEGRWLRAGAIKDSERQLVIDDFHKQLDAMNQSEDFLTQGKVIEDIQIVPTEEGFKYTYTIRQTDVPPIVVPASKADAESAAKVVAEETPVVAPVEARALTPDEVTAATGELNTATASWRNSLRERGTNPAEAWQEGELTTFKAFDATVGAEGIAAHGMAKAGSLREGVEQLTKILDEGIDPSRTLYTDNLVASGKGSGAGTGTAGGKAYRDGPFILVFKKGATETTTENISSVLVNPANAEIIPQLQKRFPNMTFRSYDEVQGAVDQAIGAAPAAKAAPSPKPEPALTGGEAVAKAAADAPDSIIVANSNVTRTQTAVIIEGEHEAVAAALKAAGLPPGAQNKVRGNSYTSLAPHLYDQVLEALADAGGIHKGIKAANASEESLARATANHAAARAEAEAGAVGNLGGTAATKPAAPVTVPTVEATQAAAAEISAKSPKFLKQSGEVVMTKDNYTGTYRVTTESLEKGTLHSKVESPTAWARGETMEEDFVKAATDELVATGVADGVTKHVTEMLEKAFAPLRGIKHLKARKRLAAVLEHGDTFINPGSAERGRTFTPQELLEGFEIKGFKDKVRLTTPEEVTAYYRVRMFEDSMYQVENQAMRRRLQLEGMSQIKSIAGTHLGKVYEGKSLDALLLHNPGAQLFKADTGDMVEAARAEELADALADGYQVVRTREPINTKGTLVGDESAVYTDLLLVKKEGIQGLPAQVLHYRQGYVTKINKAQYMVKKVFNMNIPGRPGEKGTMAVRGFNSLKDAEQFRYEQATKYVAENPNVTFEQAKAKFTIGGADEEGAFAATEMGTGRTGGLFTGMRAKHDIVFGLSGKDMERVSVQETLMRQAAHVGKLVARNELRLRNETVWLNTVRKLLPDVRTIGFEGTKLPANGTGKALDRIRDQIRQWNGVPEVAETKMQVAVQMLHDWALNGARKTLGVDKDSIDSLLWLKHTNPVSLVKATVMHTLLGVGTPVQAYVQGSAAMVAAGRRAGISLTGGIGGDIGVTFQFAFLDNILDTSALDRAINTLIAKKGIDPIVAEAYKAYRRTGLTEGATANPDIARVAADGLGLANSFFTKAGNLSLFFYRTGELFNRRYSFIKEYAAWRKINPGKVATDEDIITITKEANKNMLEMNAANKAWWQGGAGTGMVRQVLGMATQFQQVNMKMGELLLPSFITGRSTGAGFTTAQKGRIIASQVVWFGAAGIPLGGAGINAAMNILGVDQMPAEAALAVNQGFLGFTVNAMLGNVANPEQQIDVSQRAAIGSQASSFFQEVLTSDDPIWLKMLGPAGGSMGSRYFQAMKEARIFWTGDLSSEVNGIKGEELTSIISTYAKVLGRIPSSTSNLMKALYMNNFDKILARNRKTIDAREYSFGTELAVGLGFTPSIESDTRAIEATNRNYEEMVAGYADTAVQIMHMGVFEQQMKPQSIDHLMRVLGSMYATMDNPKIALDVNNRLRERLFESPKSAHEKALHEYFKNTVGQQVSENALADIEGTLVGPAALMPYKSLYEKAQEKQ